MQVHENEQIEGSSRQIITSLKAKTDARRSIPEKIADSTTNAFGSIPFLVINITLFSLWIIINLNLIPGITPFDPFPFGLLTMIVSLEAIVLSIFVLISQNRASTIDDLRSEIDLQIDLITEQELTKLMHMVALMAEKNGIDLSQDKELTEMLKPLPREKIERSLEEQIFPTH